MILRKKMEKAKTRCQRPSCPISSLNTSFDRGAQMTRGNWGGILDHCFSQSFSIRNFYFFIFLYITKNGQKLTILKMTLKFEKMKMVIKKTFCVEVLLNSPPISPSHLSFSTNPYTREHHQTSGTGAPTFYFFRNRSFSI